MADIETTGFKAAVNAVPRPPIRVGTLGFEPRSAGFLQAGSDPARSRNARVLAPVSHHGVSKPSVSQTHNWSPPVYRVSLRPLGVAESSGSYLVFSPGRHTTTASASSARACVGASASCATSSASVRASSTPASCVSSGFKFRVLSDLLSSFRRGRCASQS